MAKYRPVYTKIWKDPDFQRYTPEEKLLFIYLCTNDSTTDSGIYPVSLDTIARETLIPSATVGQLLSNGCLRNVLYDTGSQHVFVIKFRRYNKGGRPDMVARGIAEEFKEKHQLPFWGRFVEEYPEYETVIATVAQRMRNGSLEESGLDYDFILSDGADGEGERKEMNEKRRAVFDGLKERRRYATPDGGKEAQAMTWMLKQGYSVEDILSTYDAMKLDAFWLDKHLDMQSVKKQIGAKMQSKGVGVVGKDSGPPVRQYRE